MLLLRIDQRLNLLGVGGPSTAAPFYYGLNPLLRTDQALDLLVVGLAQHDREVLRLLVHDRHHALVQLFLEAL